jgi:hypothetical protein
MVVGTGQSFSAALMAMNSWVSINESDASSSTKISFDLLDDFFLPIQWQRSRVCGKRSVAAARTVVELWKLGFFAKDERVKGKDRVRTRRRGRPLNRFTTVKTRPIRPA